MRRHLDHHRRQVILRLAEAGEIKHRLLEAQDNLACLLVAIGPDTASILSVTEPHAIWDLASTIPSVVSSTRSPGSSPIDRSGEGPSPTNRQRDSATLEHAFHVAGRPEHVGRRMSQIDVLQPAERRLDLYNTNVTKRSSSVS